MKKATLVLPLLALLLFSSIAMAESYTFGTHEARTNISFVGEADIETIHGFTNQLNGSVGIESGALSGEAKLTIDVTTLDTGIALRDEHMQGEMWLDVANHPSIELELSSLTQVGDTKTWRFEGALTIKGSTKTITGEAKVKFVDEEKATKFKLGAGEWVNVKTSFEVDLSDFGIEVPEGVAAKVSNTWSISVDIWGTTSP